MIKNCIIGDNTKIWQPELVNLYDCTIGNNCNIAAFVEIGKNVVIGNNVKIQAFVYIPELVTIEDDVFIGPGVVFTNKKYPLKDGWKQTLVKKGAVIGANATILPGVTIGENSIIAAGSTVVRDTKPDKLYINKSVIENSKDMRGIYGDNSV